MDEAWSLRRRHGDAALIAAQEKLDRPDLTRWGRDVLREAVRLLRSKKIERGSPFNHGHADALLTGSASNDRGSAPVVPAPEPVRPGPPPHAEPGEPAVMPLRDPPTLLDSMRASRGLGPPALAASPPGDPARLFIVSQRAKRIHILNVDGGAMAPAPFLTLADDRPADEEYRLLGIAFHPDYAVHGRFFVYLIDDTGTVEVRAYVRADADHADPFSARTVMWFHHPFARAGGRHGPVGHTLPGAWPDGEPPEIAPTTLTFDGRGRLYAIGPDGEVRRLKTHEVVGGDRMLDAGLASALSYGRVPRGFSGNA